MSQPFEVEGEAILVKVSDEEATFLETLPEILDAVGDDPRDPALPRMTPVAYVGDVASQAEFAEWTADELQDARETDRELFERLMRPGGLATFEEAGSLLRVLVESRLVLALRLGVEDESDYEALSEGDRWVLEYLAWLQMSLIEAVGV